MTMIRIRWRNALSVLGLCTLLLAGCTPFIGTSRPEFREVLLQGEGKDKILLIDINGIITNTPIFIPNIGLIPGMTARVRQELEIAFEDPLIRGVLLRINSPGGTLTDSDIIYHSLMEFKKSKKVKIVAALGDIADEVTEQGANIVSITPETASYNREMKDRLGLSFPFLTDIDNSYGLELGIAMPVSTEIRELIQPRGLDLTVFQKNDAWFVPLPAIFIVDRNSIVRKAYVNPDYRQRFDPSPIPAESNTVDTIASLAFAAAKTERIKLGTGILLLPQRDPIVLAKELAGVDVLSKGRLLFGIGVGYLKPEFEALGIPFDKKGARTDEYLDAMHAVWTQDKPSFEGEFVSFSNINAFPRPAQQPPPVHVGGWSAGAYKRSVERGAGWYGFALDVDGARKCIDGVRDAEKRFERPAALGSLEISVTPPAGPIDADTVARYADLGVDRLILLLGAFAKEPSSEATRRWIDEIAALAG